MGNSAEKGSHRMWTQRAMAVCVVVLVLSGCKAKQQDSQAETKTQRVAVPQAQTKSSPPQDAPLAEGMPSNASETQARALSRYNENAWFIQEAMRVAQRDETLNAAISTLVKAGRPDWDHSNPSHQQIRGAEISARLRPWVEALQTLEPAKSRATRLRKAACRIKTFRESAEVRSATSIGKNWRAVLL